MLSVDCITERRRRMRAEKGEKYREKEVCEEEANIWMRMRFVLFGFEDEVRSVRSDFVTWSEDVGEEVAA